VSISDSLQPDKGSSETILEILRDKDSTTASELAEAEYIRVSRPQVSRRLKKLNNHGLVQHLGNGVYRESRHSACFGVDEWESVSAGNSRSWRLDLDRGDTIIAEAVKTGEDARPRVIIEDPDGNALADVGPQENIEREVTVAQSGRHYVDFYNEALVNSGEWDMDITYIYEEEVEIC